MREFIKKNWNGYDTVRSEDRHHFEFTKGDKTASFDFYMGDAGSFVLENLVGISREKANILAYRLWWSF